ncbi:MAG: YcxB family protein [Gemmataceae bacterium]
MFGSLLVLVPAAVVGWFVYPAFVRAQQRKSARALYTAEPFVRMAGPRTYELLDDGILDATADTFRKTRWLAVYAIDEDADYGFVVLPAGTLIIPRRSFASADDFAKFMALARSHFERVREVERRS